MNTEQVEGKFDQLKGEIKKTWGKLTDDDIELANGNATKFYGVLKEKYGLTKEEAEERLNDMKKSYNDKAA
jgi:uncharacterized protein YjbJ (UPF0337 family)